MLTKIPDEALHLADDCQIARSLRKHGHSVSTTGRMVSAVHSQTGKYVAWAASLDGSPHRLSYRAQIIRALVVFGFFALLIWAL